VMRMPDASTCFTEAVRRVRERGRADARPANSFRRGRARSSPSDCP
jgi:hypothetical protein